MARSPVSSSTYDVFLNFRGPDTRSGFTKNLYDKLTKKGIRVFMDAENMDKGKGITDVLVKAIEGSKIAIIVFSERYASSTWCLDELEMILECKDMKGQLVIPIFYKVKPTVVRRQKDSYAEHMLGHERTYRQDRDKVLRWREALSKAADISGWETESHPYEKNLINEVVEHVLKNLSDNGSSKSQASAAQGYVHRNSSMATTDTKTMKVKGRGKAIATYDDEEDDYDEDDEDDDDYDEKDDDDDHYKNMFEEFFGPITDGQVIGIHSSSELEKMLSAASKKSGLAILYFTATWCAPSVSIAPVFTSLAKEYPKVLFLKIDGDEAPDVFDKWKIFAVPCFFFMKNGAVVDKVEGSNQAKLKSACLNLMKEAADVLKVGKVIEIHSLGEMEKTLVGAWNASGLAVLYFTLSWYAPSASMEPVFRSLAKEYPKLVFLKIDANVAGAAEVANFWKISFFPSFVFMRNGVVTCLVAGPNEAQLKFKTSEHAYLNS